MHMVVLEVLLHHWCYTYEGQIDLAEEKNGTFRAKNCSFFFFQYSNMIKTIPTVKHGQYFQRPPPLTFTSAVVYATSFVYERTYVLEAI